MSVSSEDKTEMQHHTITGPPFVREVVHNVAAISNVRSDHPADIGRSVAS